MRPWQALAAKFLAQWLDPDLTDYEGDDPEPLGNVGSYSDQSEDEDVIIAHLI